MSILFKLIPFILLYSLIKSTKLKEKDSVSLVYYEYTYNISEINLEMKNPNSNIQDSIQCHLAFIKDYKSEYEEIFNFYSSYINRQWIFFSNNISAINNLLKIDYDSKDLYLFALLIPKSLENETIENEENIPLFFINDNYTENMDKWDIRYATKNIFFTIKINHFIQFYPELYFIILSFCIMICTFSLLVYYKISLKQVNAIHILPLQRFGLMLIYLNNLLCIILLIKSINIRGKKVYEDEDESSILIDTALFTLNGMYKTTLWAFALILGYGWNISIQQISQRDCKFFLRTLLLIFFTLSIDQIIDAIFPPIFTINISEIKNAIFYSIIIFIICKRIQKNINFLKFKIQYCILISPEFIDSLVYKINLVKKLRILCILYLVFYIILVALNKTVFSKYDNSVFESYDYLALDALFLYALLILFRPKKLPINYKVDLGDNLDIDEGNIYKYRLPKYSEAFSKNENLTKKQIESCKKHEIPIVVIGPNNKNIENEDNMINNNSINKYFLNLNLGFANNSK